MVRIAVGLALTLSAGAKPARAAFTGDCNNLGSVAINNVQNCVNIFLSTQPLASCPNCDQNASGTVDVNEVQGAVNCYLDPTSVSCPQVTPVAATPTSTSVPPTPTNTPLPSTNTPVPSTNTPTVTSTKTSLPTSTPTSTSVIILPTNTSTVPAPTATNTATTVPTNTSVPPTNTPGGVAVCGNGIVESPETCDDGGYCLGGDHNDATYSQKCPAGAPNVPGGVTCAGGNTCQPAGADGCAVNCTTETTVNFEFTGASCVGGAKNGQSCSFIANCVGGSVAGKPCQSNLDCGNTPTQGVCTSECATGNDGGACFGVGYCATGDAGKIGTTCPSAVSANYPPPPVLLCQGGSTAGVSCAGPLVCQNNPSQTCTTAADCGGSSCINPCGTGTCINPCGTNGSCLHRSGAVLQAIGTLIKALPVGPLIGGQEYHYGQPGPDGRVPIAVPASSVHFAPLKVPNLACACVRASADPDVHGPGNSASGFLACGAGGLPNVDVVVSQDHDTHDTSTVVPPRNGPGTCSGGSRAGLVCSGNSNECPGGGTCNGKGGGGGMCAGGTNKQKVCHADTDCPGSLCVSPDDATCVAQEPGPPAGSGSVACLEKKQVCTSGPKIGAACTNNAQCGTGNFCGNSCNALSSHGATQTCNGPRRLTFSGNGPQGSALIINTTAIGTIGPTDDPGGNCSRSGVCTTFAVGATAVTCQVDVECPGVAAGRCASAYCAGTCSNNPTVACIANATCGTGTCVAGANFSKPCTGVNTCGTSNICVPADRAKGFDGLPCTDDDDITTKGSPATVPTTTGTASANAIDADDGSGGSAPAGKLIIEGLCSGSPQPLSVCVTQAHGAPLNCAALGTPGVLSGASLATAFPNLDQSQIFDDAVTTIFTAK